MTAIPSDTAGSKSTVKIMANIFISFIGAGILGLPFAFYEAGILEGTSIMLFVGLCSVKAMLLVVDCKHKLIAKSPRRTASNGTAKSNKNEKGEKSEREDLLEVDAEMQIEDPSLPPAPGQNLTYGDVGYYALGNPGRLLVDVVIVVSQVGFCCAYLIFICENLRDYVESLRLIHWLCVLLPPLFGLTLLRHLSSLAISSLFAQLSNLMAFAVVFWFDFEHFYQVDIHPREISLEGFPFFLAIAIYCYEGAGMILSLEGSLHKDVRPHFKAYFKLTMCVVTLLYISFGVCGYLSFGPETNEIITLNLPKGSALDFAMVVKSCLCLALFFTYPVMMFPVINIIETKVIRNAHDNPRKGNALRLFMVILTGVVVLAVPNFANLMALVGATCCTMIAFVLPGIFHLKLFRGTLTKWQFSVDAFLIFLGVAGSVVGTMDALVRLQETHSGVDKIGDQPLVIHFNVSTVPTIASNVAVDKVEQWITTRPPPHPPTSQARSKSPENLPNTTSPPVEPKITRTPQWKETDDGGNIRDTSAGETVSVPSEHRVKEPDKLDNSQTVPSNATEPLLNPDPSGSDVTEAHQSHSGGPSGDKPKEQQGSGQRTNTEELTGAAGQAARTPIASEISASERENTLPATPQETRPATPEEKSSSKTATLDNSLSNGKGPSTIQ